MCLTPCKCEADYVLPSCSQFELNADLSSHVLCVMRSEHHDKVCLLVVLQESCAMLCGTDCC